MFTRVMFPRKAATVGQVMTRGARTCGPDDSLSRAAQVMWEGDCGCVPVVDADGKAIAMITDRDVCVAAFTRDLAPSKMLVSSAASRRLVTIREEDTLETAGSLMSRHQIRRLPVVDSKGRLVGVLSMNDLARHAHSSRRPWDRHADPVARTPPP